MMDIEFLFGLLGAVLTVMIFSYLLGDNLFFGIALQVLVGVVTGYTAAVLIQKVILPYLIEPLTQVGSSAFYLSLVPAIFSILLVMMIFKRASNFGKVPLAFLSGVLAAMAIIGVARGTIAPQLSGIIDNFSPELLSQQYSANWSGIFQALMMLAGVIGVLLFSHHHISKKSGEPMHTSFGQGLSAFGQIFIGILFGALFVGLFSSALIALISSLTMIKDFLLQLF